MGKLKNVTAHELATLDEMATRLLHEIRDHANCVEKGYCDDIEKPYDIAQTFLSLTRAAADMASLMFVRHGLNEQRRELEALRRETEALHRQKSRDPE